MEHKNDIYHLFEKAFAYQSDIGFMKSLDTDKAYEVVIDAIHHRERKKKIWQLFYRVAAIIVLPLLLSTATFFFPLSFFPQQTDSYFKDRILLAK